MLDSDPAIDQLATLLRPEQKTLWVADEHPLSSQLLQRLADCKVVLLSNRFEQVELAKSAGVHACFSDFEASHFESDYEQILFRVSKEKPIVHAVINRAYQALPVSGELVIAGHKNEGIKSYIEKTAKLFSSDPEIERGKAQLSIARFQKSEASDESVFLDDSDYSSIRAIGEIEGDSVVSKPGQYGWKKFDAGSQLLIEEIKRQIAEGLSGSVLDLGCGYGYLAICATGLGATRIVATDNCAAALASCEENLKNFDVNNFEVVASNAAQEIDEQFDTIICNPPFHQGFKSNSELTHRFLQAIPRNLKHDGEAWFVVNQFIPLPKLAEEIGLTCELSIQQNGFRVFRLSVK